MDPSVAVVGATGAVGELMRTVLEERNFPAHAVEAIRSQTIATADKSFTSEPFHLR